jgi:hypothetical protein
MAIGERMVFFPLSIGNKSIRAIPPPMLPLLSLKQTGIPDINDNMLLLYSLLTNWLGEVI